MCRAEETSFDAFNESSVAETQLNETGKQLFLILEKQRGGDLPRYFCEKVNEAINAISIEFLSDVSVLNDSTENTHVGSSEDSNRYHSSLMEQSPGQLTPNGKRVVSILDTYNEQRQELSRELKKKIENAINRWTDEFLRHQFHLAAEKVLTHSLSRDELKRGLGDDCLNEAYVETMIRCVPQVLSRGSPSTWQVPILWSMVWQALWDMREEDVDLERALKSISLIPLVAKMGVSMGHFTEEQRGGLLVQRSDRTTTFCDLCRARYSFKGDEKCQRVMDQAVVTILQRLRDEKLLRKEDIRNSRVLNKIVDKYRLGEGGYFGEKRFQFFVEWDPTILAAPLEACGDNNFESHSGRRIINHAAQFADSRAFCMVFQASMKYYPRQLGFVFSPSRDGSPYFHACEKSENQECTNEILDQILKYIELNTENVLLAATSDGDIGLDGLYFLLRRSGKLQPLLKGVHSFNKVGS